MRITLQYFEGCPHWHTLDQRLRRLLPARPDVELTYQRLDSAEDAEAFGCPGSPTLLVDGRDPFPAPGPRMGLACRLYPTPQGPARSPPPSSRAGARRGRRPSTGPARTDGDDARLMMHTTACRVMSRRGQRRSCAPPAGDQRPDGGCSEPGWE